MNLTIEQYHQQLPEAAGDICMTLHSIISSALPEAESKVWHGHPVWFSMPIPWWAITSGKGEWFSCFGVVSPSKNRC